jgi:hypothetical protein
MPEKRTYRDRAEYLKQAVTKRRRKLKAMVVEYRGGSCILCGYSRCTGALDLHHVDESLKEFGLSLKGMTRSWERIKKEADKCVLVCANCHREIHAGIAKIPARIANKFKN